MTIRHIAVRDIVVSGENPRATFNKESLEHLAESIATHGLLQPILVRSKDGGYELVVGERRFRAVKMLGHKSILAKVDQLDDAACYELRLIENTQREDLTDAEKGDAIYVLIEHFPEKYPTIKSVADAINKSHKTVLGWTAKTRKLSDYVKSCIHVDDGIGEQTAKLLLKYNHEVQDKLAKQIIDHEMTYEKAKRVCRFYDENPEANLNDLAKKVMQTENDVTIDMSKLSPKVRAEIEKLKKQKQKEIEEKRKQSLKVARQAPRRLRRRKKQHNSPRRSAKPTLAPTQASMPNVFTQPPEEGILYTLTIPQQLFNTVTTFASELNKTIDETILYTIEQFFERQEEKA